MRENYRLYFLISLGLHAGILLLLLLIEGPRLPEPTTRRVVIRFTDRPLPRRSAGAPQQHLLPDLDTRELAHSLQLEGPRVLSLPGSRMSTRPQTSASGDRERAVFSASEAPLLPGKSFTVPVPTIDQLIGPEDRGSKAVRSPTAKPAGQDSGFMQPGALEWKGRERNLLKMARVAFPEILLEEGLEVDVEALFTVASSGQVIDVEIVRSSGYASVDRAVERALLSYLFEQSADADNDLGQIQFRFRLER